ncbi:uncharacterized protein LOC141673741 [Apium graveolens]|uniref:uncharacterized protein LOC141673741 n=1 Tax=Apium graveolens TaxID=4045 RepID=UPI003D7B9AE6
MHNTSLIRGVAKDVLGSTSGKIHDQKEAWWWNANVQERVKDKQARFKELMCYNEQEEFDIKKIIYKEAKRLAKKAVGEAKDKAYEEMYLGLSTNEGANGIYKLAKARERRQRDLGFVRFIKDEDAHVLVKDEDIKCRWYHYFGKLFNESCLSGAAMEGEIICQAQ